MEDTKFVVRHLGYSYVYLLLLLSSSSLVSLINEYDYRQYLLMHPKVTHKSNSRGTGPSAMVTGNRGGRGD